MVKFLSKHKGVFVVFLSVVTAFALVSLTVYSATTISTNVNTGGTLTVSGASTLSNTLTVSGLAIFNGQLQASSTALFGSTSTFYDTVTISGAKGLVLGTNTSNITGSAGMIYYDSVNKVIKMNDGTNWFTVGTTTSGISLSDNRLQLADITKQYLAVGTSSVPDLSVLTAQATTTDAIPLTIRGWVGQTANLFQVLNNAYTNLFSIGSAGTTTMTIGTDIGGGYGAGGTGASIYTNGTILTNGDLAVDGYATTTRANGNIATLGTLTVTGLTTVGFASSTSVSLTQNVLVNGMATTTGANGNIATEGKFGVATSTPSAEFSATSAATTTAYLNSSGSGVGGCIQLISTAGAVWRMYIGKADIATTTNGRPTTALPAYWEPGSCK